MSLICAERELAHLLDPPAAEERSARVVWRLGGVARLATADEELLMAVGGLSGYEARRVRAAFRLVPTVLAASPPLPLTNPGAVVRHVSWLCQRSIEEVWVVCVNSALRPLGSHGVARGTRAACALDAGDVLRPALLHQAQGLFALHNHPSGDETPSRADRRFTARIQAACKIMGLELHDHIVVAGDRWHSCVNDRRGTVLEPMGTGSGDRSL